MPILEVVKIFVLLDLILFSPANLDEYTQLDSIDERVNNKGLSFCSDYREIECM